MGAHNPLAPVLETERLRLRPLTLQDFDRLAEFYASPDSRFVDGPKPRDEVWRDFASDVGQWVLLGFGTWAVEDRAGADYLGLVALNRPIHYPERELGWIFWPEFHGQGFAFEAALRARLFAYEELGWETAVSYIDPRNDRSVRLAEKMGATRDPDAATPHGEACLVYRHLRPAVL